MKFAATVIAVLVSLLLPITVSAAAWGVGLVEYPSMAAFRAMITSPEYAAISHHRTAGLAAQLNIRTQKGGSL